jgi:hypothetical protein
MAGEEENSRTLDYSGGLRGLCCGERFAAEIDGD